jgi:hypothetical protein
VIWKSAKFELPAPPDAAHAACSAAAARLDWEVSKSKPDKLRVKLPYGAGGMLGRIEVSLRASGAGTSVRARASAHEDGMLEKMKLGRSVERYVETVRLELEGRAEPA